MNLRERYRQEIEFTDAVAEKKLSGLPENITRPKINSFEDLCRNIDYLSSVSGFLGNISGKRILEIGCGDGWISLRFAKSGARAWACDISPRMIEFAGRYAEAAGLDITFETMICEEMTFEDSFFDIVFMHMALHHCDIPVAVKQIHRVLKPGGKAVIVDDYAHHPVLGIYRALTPQKHTPEEHPLRDKDISALMSPFSSGSIEYSGLTNIFEASNNRFLMILKPVTRRIDNFLYTHFEKVKEYSRIIVVKMIK